MKWFVCLAMIFFSTVPATSANACPGRSYYLQQTKNAKKASQIMQRFASYSSHLIQVKKMEELGVYGSFTYAAPQKTILTFIMKYGLQHRDTTMQLAALSALNTMHRKASGAVPGLVHYAKEQTWEMTRRVMRLLANIATHKTHLLTPLFRSKHRKVRLMAMLTISRMKTVYWSGLYRSILPSLLTALNDQKYYVVQENRKNKAYMVQRIAMRLFRKIALHTMLTPKIIPILKGHSAWRFVSVAREAQKAVVLMEKLHAKRIRLGHVRAYEEALKRDGHLRR